MSGGWSDKFRKKNKSDNDSDPKGDESAGFSGNFQKRQYVNVEKKENSNFSEGVRKKLDSESSGGYSNAIKNSRLDCLFLVRGKDKGRPAWHYVMVHKRLKGQFLEKIKTGNIDVADYGDVVKSGWGVDPPQGVIDEIKKKFNF